MYDIPVVCIVDDDQSVREATKRFVNCLGLIGHGFDRAQTFLDSPQLAETSCVIADVHMPCMSGIDLQSALVARGHRIPIVFLTAFPEEGIRAKVLAAGAIDLLTKPCDGAGLIRCLELALKRHCGEEQG